MVEIMERKTSGLTGPVGAAEEFDSRETLWEKRDQKE